MGSQVAKLVPRNLTRFHRQGFVASQKLQHWFQQLWGGKQEIYKDVLHIGDGFDTDISYLFFF
jgi:hypothetical protein